MAAVTHDQTLQKLDLFPDGITVCYLIARLPGCWLNERARRAMWSIRGLWRRLD
ncbi:hypothetical protein J6590_049081 [Homalodisca vitripennis]|nr:hypothetical protein J6590_049081 [Homalodisca vitripennis]